MEITYSDLLPHSEFYKKYEKVDDNNPLLYSRFVDEIECNDNIDDFVNDPKNDKILKDFSACCNVIGSINDIENLKTCRNICKNKDGSSTKKKYILLYLYIKSVQASVQSSNIYNAPTANFVVGNCCYRYTSKTKYSTILKEATIKKNNENFKKSITSSINYLKNGPVEEEESTEFKNVKNNDISQKTENSEPVKKPPPKSDPISQNNEIDLQDKLNVNVDNSNISPDSEQLHQNISQMPTLEANPLNERIALEKSAYDPPNMAAHERTLELYEKAKKYGDDENAQLKAIIQTEDNPLKINSNKYTPNAVQPDDNKNWDNQQEISKLVFDEQGIDADFNNKGDLLQINESSSDNLLKKDYPNSSELDKVLPKSVYQSNDESNSSLASFDSEQINKEIKNKTFQLELANDVIVDEKNNQLKITPFNENLIKNNPEILSKLQNEIGKKFVNVKDEKINDDLLKNFKRNTINENGFNDIFNYYAKMIINYPKSTNLKNFIYEIKKNVFKDLSTDIKYNQNQEKPLPVEYVQKFLADFNNIRNDNPKLDKLLKMLDSPYLPGFNKNDLSSYFKNQGNNNYNAIFNYEGEKMIFSNMISEFLYNGWEPAKQEVWKNHIIALNTYPDDVYQFNQKLKEQIIKQAMYDNYERYKYFKLFNVPPDYNMIEINKSINKSNKQNMKSILEDYNKKYTAKNDKPNSIYKPSKLLFKTGNADGVISDNVPILNKLSFRYDKLLKRIQTSNDMSNSNANLSISTDEGYDNHFNDINYVRNFDVEGSRNPKNIQIQDENGEVKNAKIKMALNNVIKQNKLLF